MEPPPLFQCPISMELMEDPVTVATGVTYDRRSMERWFFRLAVNVLWLVACAPTPAERVLEDMVVGGAVAKLLALMQVESSPSTKDKAVKMLRAHGAFWRQ
ncbi:Os02g0215650 [Oryza sativa Japonica Group]|uniref:U-box domain-containing protein n=1 Tax=Oryza sativa subsp. japonica TaxID=39947 RepID=C7IYN7_ORYSJ|nr:Os02g0215650 [Oryza sativa Japonica Group]|eukprot:NP_001172858.1 Os02g0215650 [Oryza sativa Japonica Group]